MKYLLLLLCGAALLHAEEATFSGSLALDAAINTAIQENRIPGAVLLVGQPGRVLHRKAYGKRALEPREEKMTEDTIFDAASLTKVVATTSCLMRLVEEGRVRLEDRVTEYLPKFQGGKSDITVRHLLTHFSGLRPDVDLTPVWNGYETGVQLALIDKPINPPGTRFTYSDINFVLLGEMVRVLTGQSLAEYAQQQVFQPLGMTETRFQPPTVWQGRIAPTEWLPGDVQPLRGIVHDPTTRYMGGIAGHAGLFTTAEDLSHFAEMMLGEGTYKGKRVFSPLTIRTFTKPQTPARQPILRGLGWDIDSPFSSNRGELFPIGSFGHTGFTGMSMWIDPASKTYVLLLSNSVHPKLRPAISGLRSKVATIVAAQVGIATQKVLLTSYNEAQLGPGVQRTVERNAPVKTGLDVLAEQQFAHLRGKRVGLITNHTGLSVDFRRNIDMMKAGGVQLTALFSPEHGFAGKEDHENIGNTKDEVSGVPVYSLYSGKTRRPSPAMLREVDTLVFDIQDVGARFYTYLCTMANALEEAAKTGKEFVVLDRPNPITGTRVEGPMLDNNLQSFVGCYALPVRHGMTAGEIARMINAEKKLNAKLTVISMQNWQRGDWFDATRLPWRDPSPNMRSLNAALLYPGVALLEYSRNYSVGRGTDAPFEQVGADWIQGRELAAALNARMIPGIRVYPTRFQPVSSNLAGKMVEGVRFVITDRDAFHSTRFGMELAAALLRLYPGKLQLSVNEKLIGSTATVTALERGEDVRALQLQQDQDIARFIERRKPYLLY